MTTTKWDARFMTLAKMVATWSKDESTKVGAVITEGKRIVSMGFNGFPAGVNDCVVDRETKLMRTIHAEENAILFAGRGLQGCSIYVTHIPCANCAAKIIQSGIKIVIAPLVYDDDGFLHRWNAHIIESEKLFSEAGVKLIYLVGEEK